MSMQYMGSVVFDGVTIPVLNSSLNSQPSPVAPDLVWGNAWHVNYSRGLLKSSGSITMPLFASTLSVVKQHCIETDTRNTFFKIVQDNGGLVQEFDNCKCSEFSFSIDGLSGSIIDCTVGIVAKARDSVSASSNSLPTSSPIAQNTNDSTPYPAYMANVTFGGITGSSVVKFDCQINHNPFLLYTLDGSRTAQDIQLGLVTVQGSASFYPSTTTDLDGSAVTVQLGSTSFISIPKVLITADSASITSPNEKPFRTVSWQGIGTTVPIIS